MSARKTGILLIVVLLIAVGIGVGVRLAGSHGHVSVASDAPAAPRPERPPRPQRGPGAPEGAEGMGVPAGEVAASGLPAPSSPPVAEGRFALGVNEGVSVPNRLLDSEMDASSLAAALGQDAVELDHLGATYVRGHTGAFPRISMLSLQQRPERLEAEGDAWVRAVQASGLTPVGMLSPWPANHTANYATDYLPDMDAYRAYVRRVVERYDGDGVDDMPGLTRPVRYWEVDNEPDLKWNDPPRDAKRVVEPHSFCSPEEYGQVVVATAAAAREASAQVRILAGGVFRPYAASGEEYLQQTFAVAGVLAAVDVVSIHGYDASRDAERIRVGVAAARAYAPGKPVWITESSLPTGQGVDEAEQGRRLVAIVGSAAVAGAGAVFWHTLADPPSRGAGHAGNFSTNSLMRTGEGDVHEEKPAGAAYRSLAAVLREHELFGAKADGAGAARLADGSVLLWDGSRLAPNGGVNLRTGAALVAGATAEAPAFLR